MCQADMHLFFHPQTIYLHIVALKICIGVYNLSGSGGLLIILGIVLLAA